MESIPLQDTLMRLLAAAVLGGAIGWEREAKGRSAGLRTHVLVSTGAALVTLTMIYLNQTHSFGVPDTRMAAAVITGVGFLGAGAIIKSGEHVNGITTAASVWINAAIGIAIGCGFLSGAVIATAVALFTLTVLQMLEKSDSNSKGADHA